MPFKTYLIDKFDHTHENLLFRSISVDLRKRFENENGLHVLIGNISVDGNAIDALFICRGQINVIDFKDYSGVLHFTENGPWIIKNNGDNGLEVKGGTHLNPFIQIKKYRISVLKYLKKYQCSILEKNRDDFSWGHTGAIVLFKNIIINNFSEIPNKVKKWFHITDEENLFYLLSDMNSEKLNFSDKEINNLLKVLNIDNKFSYDHQFPNPKTAGIELPKKYKKIHRIKRWAARPEQANHKIVMAFLELEKAGIVYLKDFRALCSDPNSKYYINGFNGHYASMKTDAGNAHGIVFYDESEIVSIWPEVREEILKYFPVS